MRHASFAFVLPLTLALGVSARAQATLPTEWDMRKTLESITSHSDRLMPLLDQVRPKDWVVSGASETYLQQWNSARTQAESLKVSVANLSREPEKLTAALDLFLRMQTIDVLLNSLVEGTRKYQNPALADLLQGVMSENGASRQLLQQYVVDLAAMNENQLRVMDQEAQRCRTTLSKQPGPAPAVKKKVGK